MIIKCKRRILKQPHSLFYIVTYNLSKVIGFTLQRKGDFKLVERVFRLSKKELSLIAKIKVKVSVVLVREDAEKLKCLYDKLN